MDDSKPAIPPSELILRPASDWKSVVYSGNEEEVSRGFLIALRAMEVAVVEPLPEPAAPPISGATP